MSVYRDIYSKIKATQDNEGMSGGLGRQVRLFKLSEELGEVAQAYIGLTGANARKGVTHDEHDIAKELADVVITAMVAMHDWTPSPDIFMHGHLLQLQERIKREGS